MSLLSVMVICGSVILQQGSLLNAETSGPVWIPQYTAITDKSYYTPTQNVKK